MLVDIDYVLSVKKRLSQINSCDIEDITWIKDGVEDELSVISDNYYGEWELFYQCPLCETGVDVTDYETVEENK